VLVEHKSRPDRWAPLQMLRYLVRVSGAVHTAVGLLCLKYIQQRFSRKIVRLLLDELHRMPEDERSRRYTEAFYAAIVRSKEQEEIDLFVAQARAMRYRDSEEAVMTYGEKLLKEGLEKGKLRDKQEVLIRQLSRKFELSHEEVELIERTDDSRALDAALDEFAVAASKNQVLEHLKSSGEE
jgi:hypothetical protein